MMKIAYKDVNYDYKFGVYHDFCYVNEKFL